MSIGEKPDQSETPDKSETPEYGYTYVQGVGFVAHSPLHDERRDLYIQANAVGFVILFYVFLQKALPHYLVRSLLFFLPNIRYFNAHLMAPEWLNQAMHGLSFVLCAIIAFGLYALFVKLPLRVALPLKRPLCSMTMPAVLISLAAAVLGSLADKFLSRLLWRAGFIAIIPDFTIPQTVAGYVFAVINLVILPAFVWQCVFNGVLLQSLRRFGDAFAVLVTGTLFCIMNLNTVQLPMSFLTGLVTGYFVIRTGSLWVGIIMQLCNNFLSVTLRLLPRFSGAYSELIWLAIALICIVAGLIATISLAHTSDNLFNLSSPKLATDSGTRIKLFFTRPAMLVALAVIFVTSLQGLQRLVR
ncbi:MAG: CPBP family intramembrane glutamic endopeptidase [Hydrogenoanaerobacterium sp.]